MSAIASSHARILLSGAVIWLLATFANTLVGSGAANSPTTAIVSRITAIASLLFFAYGATVSCFKHTFIGAESAGAAGLKGGGVKEKQLALRRDDLGGFHEEELTSVTAVFVTSSALYVFLCVFVLNSMVLTHEQRNTLELVRILMTASLVGLTGPPAYLIQAWRLKKCMNRMEALGGVFATAANILVLIHPLCILLEWAVLSTSPPPIDPLLIAIFVAACAFSAPGHRWCVLEAFQGHCVIRSLRVH